MIVMKHMTIILTHFELVIQNILENLQLTQTVYKKRLVSRINQSLLLKINLYNTRTLQLNNINQMKLYTKYN